MRSLFDTVIRWSFYLLFFLVPIIFMSNTSELFEFNKMWLTFGLTLLIGASWISKMIIDRQVKIRRTILDIPVLLFLASQVLATIFSIDPHTSLWGYYSRFNGGLYSLLAYGFLYFAFMSTIKKENVLRYVFTSIASAVFVALWGLPSHFGYDPTCLLFRGTLDVSCWTFAFQPKVRIFSTLGQPDWLAAYLAYMIPIAASLGIIFWKAKQKVLAYASLTTTALLFVDLLYTKARSGFIGFGVSLVVFLVAYILFEWRSFAKHALMKAVKNNAFLLATLFVFVLFTFIIGSPLSQLDRFSLSGVQSLLAAKQTLQQVQEKKVPAAQTAIPAAELGGTDSGKIRLFVWEGAWQVFLHYPLFGTGVETFGYSYYFFRPAGHNMTSEWDYLYNKAHNEYLNYLATTGAVGFLSYMIMIGFSLWLMAATLKKLKTQPLEDNKSADILSTPFAKRLLIIGFLASYISILVTNFFGFSVVIMNIYLLITPAFVLLVSPFFTNPISAFPKKSASYADEVEWLGIGGVLIACVYFLIVLARFWMADTSYAMGLNLDHANEYQTAYSYLHDAVSTRPSEPTFQDELALNDAVLAAALYQQKDATNGAKLRDEAIAVSDMVTTNHPSVVTFWKSRVRVFYTLAQVDPQYLQQALLAIEKASKLAPTDAKVWYNLGLLYDQTGDVTKAITTLEQTVKMKPDYRDAYYALALFYRQKAVGTGKIVIDAAAEQKAVDTMHFIVDNFGADTKITDTLTAWGEK